MAEATGAMPLPHEERHGRTFTGIRRERVSDIRAGHE